MSGGGILLHVLIRAMPQNTPRDRYGVRCRVIRHIYAAPKNQAEAENLVVDDSSRPALDAVKWKELILGCFSPQFGFKPPRHFKYIKMDLLHRNSFNTTDCIREWLNCWEVVKADVICSRSKVYESVCGPMRFDCHEHHGWVERNELPIFESFCKTNNRPT